MHMPAPTPSSAAPAAAPARDLDDDELARAAGHGAFAGLLAAALSHWAWGLNLPILAFFYGFGIASLRGWPELAAILSMIASTILYFAIYEIVELDAPGLGLTLGLSAAAVALFVVVCVVVVVGGVGRMRRHALQDATSTATDVARSEQWEERYFATLRAKHAANASLTPLYIRRVASIAVAFLVAILLLDNRFAASVAWGVAFYESVVAARMVQYARRLHQPTGAQALVLAREPPILFLRPFTLDALPVSPIGDGWLAAFKVLSWVDRRTLEEHLSGTFEDLGPVVAIGRPGEEVAALGAARVYVDDASWRTVVLGLAQMSQFVIMEVDGTPGMTWELEHVSGLVGLQRILIVLPPDDDLRATRPSDWYERWAALQRQFEFLPDVAKDTAAVLYDRDDQPVLVRGDESSIQRSLAAVKQAWLEEKQRAGPVRDIDEQDAEIVRRVMLGRFQITLGNFSGARELLTDAQTMARERHGDAHELTIAAGTLVAMALERDGHWDAALELERQLIDACRQRYGDDHPEVVAAMGRLAATLSEMGRLPEARALGEEAHARAEAALGADDVQTLAIARGLANTLAGLDQRAAAEALYADVADRSRRALGPEHPETLTTVSRMAAWLARDRPEEARPLQEQVYEARRRLLGADHPDTAIAANNLAQTLRMIGNDGALRLQEEARDSHHRAFGAAHRLTLVAENNLARMLGQSGELPRAIVLQERVVDELARAAGPLHPNTLAARMNLGEMARLAGDATRSRAHLEEAHAGLAQTLGAEHPQHAGGGRRARSDPPGRRRRRGRTRPRHRPAGARRTCLRSRRRNGGRPAVRPGRDLRSGGAHRSIGPEVPERPVDVVAAVRAGRAGAQTGQHLLEHELLDERRAQVEVLDLGQVLLLV